MKVLLVTPYYYPKIGGLENYALQLGLSMQATGNVEIVVVTSNHRSHHSIEETVGGVKVYRLGPWFRLANTPVNPLWPIMVRRVMNREQPDVIHAHTPVPSMADAAALAAGRTPLVVTYHAATVLKQGQPIFNLLARLYRMYERLTLHRAARIVAVSDFVKQQLGPAYAHKTVVVPNAIWRQEIEPRKQPDKTNFIFIGSLDRTHAWKGLKNIILAIKAYQHDYGNTVQLTVVGDGNQRKEYESLVRTHGLDSNITFVGAKTGADKDNLLRAATALICYPSTSNDAFPTVFLEAWAKGVPVVAGRIGAIPSLINDGGDGILVEPGNPEALAHALHQLVSDKRLRNKVATAAQRRTKEHYTWELQGQAMVEVLRQV